ncbi:hypothetical protein SBRCBS47491_003515 [Sporothrix bragantina]|uniref:Glycosyl hydrolase family 13 catalytic domain-containing protein n=1 Tax=Sporothrix bragantina TaxID=671064 RepID=A0ABP0BFT3_9PEZI
MGSTFTSQAWWKDAVVYQVYPASFKDSNGDGIGDIPGLIAKADYLSALGINVVWLSPMYKSPQVDMGYDIADYEDIHAPFGKLADMDVLIEALHSRGIKLILDLVINHTSDQHAWFQESRASRDSPKRDWYIWRPARYDAQGQRQPPNNWRANFGGSVWEWDEPTQEYYLHYFAKEQPDLNWENPTTRQAIYDSAVRFWLRRGIDGFRVDTVNKYSKPLEFPDAPVTDPASPWQFAYPLFCNGPRIHEFLREMVREALDPFGGPGHVMTVGELPSTPDPVDIKRYVSARAHELNMVLSFDMVYLGMGTVRKYLPQPFNLCDVKAALARWQHMAAESDGDMWTTVFAENHDSARSISRFASDAPEHREASARLLALMLTSLTGTLFIYQGQEIGMVNLPRAWPVDEYRDLETHNFYAAMQAEAAKAGSPAEADKIMTAAMDGINVLARDHARSPMQWDASPNAGFTSAPADGSVQPWMRVNDNYREINVAAQMDKAGSPLEFWRRLLSFRRQHRHLFVYGEFVEHDHDNPFVFTYTKLIDHASGIEAGEDAGPHPAAKALVSLNFTDQPQAVCFPVDCSADKCELAISSTSVDKVTDIAVLQPYEGRIYWVR